jgi:bifunctional non-homologous end joining protein LigD
VSRRGILDAAEIALLLREMLRGVGLESFAKTTGSKGIQLYAPLNSPVDFEATKAFARSVAVHWGQNDRHGSTVAAYSLRAKLERPTVAAPLRWTDLSAAVDASREADLLPSPGERRSRRGAGRRFAPVLSMCHRLPG